MITVSSPYGKDPMDFNDETAANRTGQRIREIRISQGKSQVSLGNDVGVTGARIYKYEIGERKPKSDLLKKIADALGVSTLALTDPVISNYDGLMHAIFTMEKTYNLKLRQNEKGQFMLIFGDGKTGTVNEIFRVWGNERKIIKEKLAAASSNKERVAIEHEYDMWKWSYPHATTKDSNNVISEDEDIEKRRAELTEMKRQIDKELSALDSKS